ncbi:MAG TPA: acyl carrier protein [Myxococcota bacterium]|nr:acyl carrier protein [Myxococcota bacterium]HRY94889.1 acyl carrier protein [Myxococcota bacterium]HSA22668.1 acyl carrier protein [Myxococcota bacterium]
MSVEERVREIVGRVLNLAPATIRLEANLKDDLGATSLDRYAVLMDVEEAFALDLSDVPEEVLETRIQSVGDIVTFLEERKA